jgi:hypothetical protein
LFGPDRDRIPLSTPGPPSTIISQPILHKHEMLYEAKRTMKTAGAVRPHQVIDLIAR